MDTSPEPKKLPLNPSLEHLQKQAKKRVKQAPALQLAAAQHQIAQEYGFKNWPELAKAVEAMAATAQLSPAPTPKSNLPEPAAIQARLDAFLQDSDGGIGAVWVEGSKTLFFQAGTRSKTDPAPITADTLFDAGPISKVFTALLLVESERLGKVSRSDPVAKYLFPADDPVQASLKAITFLSLATHVSGLPVMPFEVDPALNAGKPLKQLARSDCERDELLKAFRHAGPAARSGGPIAYSNFGFALLGEALAAAWGAPFLEVLSRLVFEPLGMAESTVRLQALAPAEGVQTSMRDMARFLSAALGHGDAPLGSAFAATFHPQVDDRVFGGCLGLGWRLTNKTAHPAAWQSAAFGGKSFLALDRKTGAAIAIFTSAKRSPYELGFELLGVKPPKPKMEPVVEAASYVGLYPFRMGRSMEITEFKGGLRAQTAAFPPIPLLATGPDRFELGGSGSEIFFERDATGQVIALRHTQRGVRRPLPQLPAAVELPADTLLEYSGRYAVTPTFIIEVGVDGNALLVQLSGNSKLRAFASAQDQFFVESANTKIHFRRDEAAQVSGIVVSQKHGNITGNKCAK